MSIATVGGVSIRECNPKKIIIKQKRLQTVAATIVALSISGSAFAIDIKTGPISNNDDAKGKCPGVCSGLQWNGQSHTLPGGPVFEPNTACGTTAGVDIPIGPVLLGDAATKCPAQLSKTTWSGQWLDPVG